MEDNAIIGMFFDRDEQALKEVQSKYGRLLINVTDNILAKHEDAEECVSDALLAAWNSIPPNRPDHLASYICKIAKRKAIDKVKHDNAEKRKADFAVSLDELSECIPGNSDVETDEFSVKMLSKLISEFLWTQNEKSRKIFIRRYWYSDSVAAIAEMFGMSEKSVATNLFRTRGKLKKYLEKEGYSI